MAAQIFNQQAINRQLASLLQTDINEVSMPAIEFSRRTLLTAVRSTLCSSFSARLAGTARELARPSMWDYPADDGIARLVQTGLRRRTDRGRTAEDGCVKISMRAITIPAGKTLRVQGAVRGNGRGRFYLQDGCQVVGAGRQSAQCDAGCSRVGLCD